MPEHQHPVNAVRADGAAMNAISPMEMFSCMMDNEIIELLVLESNRFGMQLGKRYKPITSKEMRQFFGICMYMSVVHLPRRRMYWSRATRQPRVADCMTTNRFEEILFLLHVTDNELEPDRNSNNYDKLYKLRPMMDKLNKNFCNNAVPELCMAVDEQMVPFKGRHSMKVGLYMRSKPCRWGYKLWCLAGQSGYLRKFYVSGDKAIDEIQIPDKYNVGVSGKVVIRLTQDLPENSYIFFDNYFSSPQLIAYMKSKKIYATSTMRRNRTEKCPLLSEKQLKKMGRGSMDFKSKSGVIICEWYDNRLVTVGSNVFGVHPTKKVRRYDRKEKTHKELECPNMTVAYNKSMGGVDKSSVFSQKVVTRHNCVLSKQPIKSLN